MKNFAKRVSALLLALVVGAAALCPAALAAASLPCRTCPEISVWWMTPTS